MSIQSVFIKSYETRQQPKPHTVFSISVQTAVRGWQIWRRYSEFDALHDDLTKETSLPPPAPLPPKHSTFSIFRSTLNDTALLEERRAGLETYLRAIVASTDPRWRDTFVFRDFLGVPVGKADNAAGASGGALFTSSSWLDEHADLQTLVRDIRSDINKRDLLATHGDVSGSHTSNVQAKKKLAALVSRLESLARGIQQLGLGGMSEGEIQRRMDMIRRLQDDCNTLGKMVQAARQLSVGGASSYAASSYSTGTNPERDALLSHSGSGSSILSTSRVTRVFGKPAEPRETEQTRPLDNGGLVQLQQVQMDQQDAALGQLSAILQRQKHLGMAIGNEIEYQNDLLDGVIQDVDRTGAKLGKAKDQMRRLG